MIVKRWTAFFKSEKRQNHIDHYFTTRLIWKCDAMRCEDVNRHQLGNI